MKTITSKQAKERLISQLGDDVPDPINRYCNTTRLFPDDNRALLEDFRQYLFQSTNAVTRNIIRRQTG